eukprot:16444204-Heterocapsa_arctica.AAC.1
MESRFVIKDMSHLVTAQIVVFTETGIEAVAVSRNILNSITLLFAPLVLVISRRVFLMEEIHQFHVCTLNALSSRTRIGGLSNPINGSAVFYPFCALLRPICSHVAHPQVHLTYKVPVQKESIDVAFRVTLSML